jgi:hypothetical protein
MLKSKNKHKWKRLRPISKKRQESYIEYKKVRREYLENNPTCQRCNERRSNQIHHKRGRGRLLCVTQYFLACCSDCHDWIERNRRNAFEEKMRLDRIGITNPI